MTETKFPVVFLPAGRRGEFSAGTPLLTAARRLGVDIDSLCGGRGLCGRCQIECAEGEFSKHHITSSADHLNPKTANEVSYEQRKASLGKHRLSCHAVIEGPLVVDVPAHSQVHRQVIRKSIDERTVALETGIGLYYVEVTDATLDDARGDVERLLDALREQWQIDVHRLAPSLLPKLQKCLRREQWRVTAAVSENRVIALWPGFHDEIYGVGIDVGSTTIAAHLCDLTTGQVRATAGRMNPQIRFGEDLMSRVSYVMMNPGGEQELTACVQQALNEIIAEVCAETNVATDDVLSVVITGNPIMHHLVLGIDPTELGGAPFALAVDGAVTVPASSIGLSIHQNASVYLPPCIAGHVGADCAAAVLAQEPYKSDAMTLLVDIGTNAEIVLGNQRKLLACSQPHRSRF